jgi:hypothetical protein
MNNIKETKYTIDKLDIGYLISKNEKTKIGVKDETDLEDKIKFYLSQIADVKNLLYFGKHKSISITISVETFEPN